VAHEILVHHAVWDELATTHVAAAQRAMKKAAATPDPCHAPGATPIAHSRYPRTARLRVGRWRLLFIVFPDERVIAFTTAFLKRRTADYQAALDRHNARVRAFE
jgi:hypothetical protein